MNKITRKKVMLLIKIYNIVAKLTFIDTNRNIINILDDVSDELSKYRKYWIETNPKVGVIKLKKRYQK